MEQISLRDYCEEARSLIQSGQPDKAIHVTRRILSHYPRHVESYRLLGQALLAKGNYPEAAKQFRRVLSVDPEDATSRAGLAEVHEAAGDPDKAIWYMQRAVELSPGNTGLRAQLGQLMSARQGNDAPERIEITRVALGRIHTRSGLYAKAIQEYKAALTQDPDRMDVRAALAEALWRAGRYAEAARASQHVIEKLPNALKANLIIGATLRQNDPQSKEAESHLKLAQALDPENSVAQSIFGEESPLPPLSITIERLGEDEIESAQPEPPSAPPVESPAVQEASAAIDGVSELYEEETTPMTEEERPDEELEPLPDWLKGVGDELLEEDDQPAASDLPEPDAAEGDEAPAWLRSLISQPEEADISAESLPAESEDVPELKGPPERRPEVPRETPAASGVPDWLASIAAGKTPDELETEEDLDLESAEEPLFEEPEAPAAIPVAETEVDEVGPPDWLKDLREPEASLDAEAEEALTPTPAEGPEPSFLEPIGDAVEESEVPDWLREISTGKPPAREEAKPVPAAETFPEVPVDEAGLPDWLRDIKEPEAEEPEPEMEAVSPEGVEEPTTAAEEGQALWEQILAEEGIDLTSVEEAPPPEAAGMTAEEWLRSTADIVKAPSRPSAPEPIAEEPPLEEPETPAVPVAEPDVDEADLPDWLKEFRELETVAEAEEAALADAELEEAGLPDWLRELKEPAAEMEEPAQPELPPDLVTEVVEEEMEEAVEVEIDEAGLPDWLREPSAEAAELPEREVGLSAEMPEWLTELETDEILLTESAFEEPLELETGEMPEWLGEVMAGEPPLPEEWPAEEEIAEPAEAEVLEEEIPEWLRDFREREAAVAAEPVEEVVEPEAEVQPEPTLQPDLPAWLQRLREGAPEPEPAEPEEVPAIEAEAVPAVEMPPEPELIQPEAAGPEWLGELVRAEESLAEIEAIEEEYVPEEAAAPVLEEYAELEELEEVEAFPPEPVEVPELEAAPAVEPLGTRKLEAIRVEDLPKDPAARLSMARAALNAGDWLEALTVYETLVNSSELLDNVIDNLEVGVRRHPDDAAGYQLLGDACMKDGRLQDALQAYRTALSKL